ncbi:flagellin, partial [Simplicispira psychrophila]|uniref:flagellin n=1 Tax=Simplicispira psychrophila TaxID=80882 RepID=UPI00055E4724
FSMTIASENASTALETMSFTVPGGTGPDRLATAVSAINDKSAKTGVSASLSDDGTYVLLTNPSGSNINVGAATGVANAGVMTVQKLDAAGNTAGAGVSLSATTAGESSTVSGYITLDADKAFSFSGGAASSALAANGTSKLNKVADLDLTSFKNATEALKTVDSALGFINGERAKLGALQSRFETAISNLDVTSENLSASRSRIQDADFAKETANLSRAQILQQAGTAMVAQANQIPQGVLSLLK